MPLSRRALILTGVAAGGGLALWYGAQRLDDGDATAKFGASTPDLNALNAWIKIRDDGHVVFGVHRAEMGQGITTSLPMMLAEELDADWGRVSFEFTPNDRDYFNFGMLELGQPLGPTDDSVVAAAGTALIRRVFHAIGLTMTISSSSIIDAWDTLRPAAAAARDMLVQAAAERWRVAADSLQTRDGRVLNPATGASLDYGELAADAASRKPPAKPPVKDPAQWQLNGHSLQRLDIPGKVTGTTQYVPDLRLPGMRFAAVVHSPVAGGRIADFNGDAALEVPGVEKVTLLGDQAVAVIATNSWAALEGAKGVSVETRPGSGASGVNSSSLFDEYRAALSAPDIPLFRDDGDVTPAFTDTKAMEAEYQLGFVAHVCMEPMSCAALYDDDELTVWAPSQSQSLARDEAARITGVDPERVTVHQTFMGGSFGRRADMDFVQHAVRAAQALPGTPIQILYSREEDIRQDAYRPAVLASVRGALDDEGRIDALDYRAATQSVVASFYGRTPNPRGRGGENDGSMITAARGQVYEVPNVRVATRAMEPGVPAGYWRSPGSSGIAFIVEGFMDELAEAAGTDPLQFRLQHLASLPQHRAILEAVAKQAAWDAPLLPGQGRGIALGDSCGTLTGMAARVTLTDGKLRVDRIDCVVDLRQIINPDGASSQVEGSIVDGLAAAFYGEVTFANGIARETNFDQYRFPRLADTPPIKVELWASGGRPGGAGEPALPCVAPAVAGAIRAAGGPRLRQLPFAPALKEAGIA
jgi:isoquinoline 1-oxidoreductase beta subunit